MRNIQLVMKQPNFYLILNPHILPTSANETIDEEITDYHPVFYSAFAQMETLRNALRHTHGKRRFVVYNHDPLISFLLWKQG